MFCRNCGQIIDDQAWACPHCGVKIGQTDNQGKLLVHFCNQCGQPVSEYQSLCTGCGAIVRPENVRSAAQVMESNEFQFNNPAAPNHNQKSLWECFLDSWHLRAEGTATRREYWGAALFHILFCFTIVYIFVAWLPCLFTAIRRLHDIGRSGWWYLLNFVPYVSIVLFIFTLLPSKLENNPYRETTFIR